MRIAVVGAEGSVGKKVCAAALGAGMEVIAIDRTFEDASDAPGLSRREVDVLKGRITPALKGCEAVISALGLPFSPRNAHEPPPLYTQGTASIIDGMTELGLRRLSVVSAAFVEPQPSLPFWFTISVVPALHAILEEMRGMEAIVSSSGLDWIIARPGWLLDEPAEGKLLANDRMLAEGAFRCREADLAQFLVATASSETWLQKRPALGAPDTASNESPLALGKALAAMVG